MLNFFDNFINKILSSPYCPSARTVLLVSLFLLMGTSLLMTASASIPFALSKNLPPMYFFWSQSSYIAIGLMVGYLVYKVPVSWYFSFGILAVSWFSVLVLLGATLLFGDVINGSQRWLNLGVFNLQTAELAKMVMVLIISDYVVRRSAEVRSSLWEGKRLIVWYGPIMILLLFQPDYGSLVVIAATALVLLYVACVPKRHYALSMAAVFLPTLIIGLFMSDYRRERLLSFWNPFDDIQDTDYQLSRSLIAFGRGELTGVGYGNSVQKLAHLPEAHTDFILAITGEELGFLGVAFVLLLEALIIASIMRISYVSLKRRQVRMSYVVFGFGTVIFGQLLINAGMNMGLAPTKGLTLPFYSFGGSSMLTMLMMIAMILKVDKESLSIHQNNRNREY